MKDLTIWGNTLGRALLAYSPHARAQIAAAVKAEEMAVHAAALGLSGADCREIVGAYSAWYRALPDPMRWDDVRAAMSLRASGLPWRPEDVRD